MVSTFTDIANIALSRLGQPLLSNITDDTPNAKICNARILDVRDQVLSSFPWACCIVRDVLSPLVAPPKFAFTYAFNLPSDLLRIVDLSNSPQGRDVWLGDRIPYLIESGKILANESPLYIRYVQRVETPSQFDASCAEAIALFLAADICRIIVPNEAMIKLIKQEYLETLQEARNQQSQQNDRTMKIDYFERARLYGPS